jgi:hypothetical protein
MKPGSPQPVFNAARTLVMTDGPVPGANVYTASRSWVGSFPGAEYR